jgi:hypothetical protein
MNDGSFYTGPDGPITLEMIEHAKAAFDAACGPEPFGEYMRKAGFPPEDNWVLFLPASMVVDKTLLPRYVQVTTLFEDPTFIMSPFLSNALDQLYRSER